MNARLLWLVLALGAGVLLMTAPAVSAQPPCILITCPSNILVQVTNVGGSVVTYSATATNRCGGGVMITCAPPSGSVFPPGVTSVQCSASDGAGNSNHCSFAITANRPPVARDSGAGTTENTALTITTGKLLYYDSDPDGDPLTVVAVGAISANGGSVVLGNGRVAYTPPAGFTGLDRLNYTISDERGGADTAEVEILVAAGSLPSLNQVSVTPTPNGVLVQFSGTPGYSYVMERATSLLGSWSPLATVTAPLHGLIEFEDTNPPPDFAFYRTVLP